MGCVGVDEKRAIAAVVRAAATRRNESPFPVPEIATARRDTVLRAHKGDDEGSGLDLYVGEDEWPPMCSFSGRYWLGRLVEKREYLGGDMLGRRQSLNRASCINCQALLGVKVRGTSPGVESWEEQVRCDDEVRWCPIPF